MPAPILSTESHVLVTGVTGLIGGEVLRTLATRGFTRLSALVRPLADVTPQTRFIERMLRSGETEIDILRWGVEVLEGDVSEPGWNLSADDRQRLQDSVDIIVHCAADTSFIRNTAVLDTNVDGARHLMQLAGSCRRPPLIVYVSTATNSGKIGHRCLGEEEGCQPDNEHHNEYTRSKAIAESLLRASGLPVLTVRPPIVLSAGLSDQVFARNILWFFPFLRRFEALPIDPNSQLDVVPIDFVCDALLALLARPERRYDCYHISAGDRDGVTTGHVSALADEFYHRRKPLELIAPSGWDRTMFRKHIRTAQQRKIFAGLRYYLPFLNMDVTFDNARLREELGPRMPTVVPISHYLGSLLDQIRLKDALEKAARP
jgi:thioester reductase-like protein